uniref:SJCHGC02283 protein n=1 Tax=Schistosoma japonicum TaxID=6182 RepID=Q5DGV9_SCHJA|nr:SJCHGC02283 protein [Schistosoma japonicum]
MFVKSRISRIWLLTFTCSCIAVGLILSFTLFFTNPKIAAYVMGECGILSVIPVLVYIGQQVKSGSSKRMFDSDYILDATMISIIYLYIFYSIAVQFLEAQRHHNIVTC